MAKRLKGRSVNLARFFEKVFFILYFLSLELLEKNKKIKIKLNERAFYKGSTYAVILKKFFIELKRLQNVCLFVFFFIFTNI